MGSVSPADQITISMPPPKKSDAQIRTACCVASSNQQPEIRLASRLRMVDLSLRSATVAFLVVSLTAMLTSSQSSAVQILGFSIPVSIKWTRTQPFEFLVVVDALMCGYSLLQFIYQSVVLVRKSQSKRQRLWLQFGADQACAYLVVSAAAAAGGASRMTRAGFESIGVKNLHIPAVCAVLDKFCGRATIAITFTLLAAFASACCAVLDVYLLNSC